MYPPWSQKRKRSKLEETQMSMDGLSVLATEASRLYSPVAKEAVQNVILVGGHHQLAHGQPHLLGVKPGEDVAKVPCRDDEVRPLDFVTPITVEWYFSIRWSRGVVRGEVVDNLRHHARKVDRVDGAQVHLTVEGVVAKALLDDALGLFVHEES